jgi:hypothetical protein
MHMQNTSMSRVHRSLWLGAMSVFVGMLIAASPARAAAVVAMDDYAGAASFSKAAVSDLYASDVPTITETLYAGTTLFTGVTFTQFELDVPAAGRLTVQLQDLEFPSLTGALSFALVQGGTVLGLLPGAGVLEIDLTGPAELFAFVYGVATPGVNVGSYYLDITHAYQQPIPLPAAFWLLLSGLFSASLLGRARRRSSTGKAP